MELTFYREKSSKRETEIVHVLHFINNQVWKQLFGRKADGLEQSNNDNDEFWLNDSEPITNTFVSKSSDSAITCAAFVSGIIEGILFAIDFPATVSAHFSEEDDSGMCYQIKFTKEAKEYEERHNIKS